MANQSPDRFAFEEVDITQDLAMAQKYQIQATPTIVVLDPAGNTAGVLTGVPPEAELSALIDKAGAS